MCPIPSALTLLLERLNRVEAGEDANTPSFQTRVKIYLEALQYVKDEPSFLDYVLGHRNLVTHTRDCMEVDFPLLHLMIRHPDQIPHNFKDRLPSQSSLPPYILRIYEANRLPGKQIKSFEELLESA